MKEVAALQELFAPTVAAAGCELWGCVYIPQGRHTVLRVYIDSERGVTVANCEQVSRQLSALLDVENPVTGNYSLEVSSPGIDRPLFSLAQFQRFIGSQVDIRLHVPIEARRHFKGVLQNVAGDNVIVQVDDQAFTLPLANIAKAHLIVPTAIGSQEKRL